MFLLGLILGLALGAVAGWLVRPRLEIRAQELLPFLPSPVADAVLGGQTVAGRLDAAIAEIEGQLRNGIDRQRNATRLQILREVKEGL